MRSAASDPVEVAVALGEVEPVAETNSSPISKPRYSRGVGTIRRAALSSRAQARIDRGRRPASSRRSQVRVRPVSTMSSTTITSRSCDVELEVLHDPHPAGVGGVARQGHEVDHRVDRELADEVGQEGDAALEHADQHHAVGGRRPRSRPPPGPRPRPARPAGSGPAAARPRRAAATTSPRSSARSSWRSMAARSPWPSWVSSASASVACLRAWGLRCLSIGMTTCSKKPASRSAAVLYIRRWRASTP